MTNFKFMTDDIQYFYTYIIVLATALY